ncbi:IDEAL domain-containing protein [Cohnella silvisoli]|uniref:IDEAL domain-containing protein n=1 Tax=Cohnella silvisoli TaxID=2873699 RepID=A0ABV1KXS7_9BACL|nr:IDEAL domain-containing protein [Cohnella silvisoli]MCD9024170.1 IDEAL domain-containing protein [Cohnella silvisoli]
MKVEVSDWVQAKTNNGELIHGFIDAVDEAQRMANVIVVKSDNEESIGKPIAVREQWLRKLPEYAIEDEGSIQSLIDVALSTRDEQWFNELTEKLTTIQRNTHTGNNKPVAYPSSTNQLGYPV